MSECKHPCCGETCRKPPKQRVRKPIKRYSAKPNKKTEGQYDEMEQFWKNCYDIIAKNPYCLNCNSYISPAFYRHAVAHIAPKSIFNSVAAHPLNWLKLGAGCGCHELTHRLDKFSKMTIWPIAVQKFIQFEPFITERHKYIDEFKSYIK